MAEGNEIRTETDYATALARVEELMDAEPATPEGEELDTLVDLVERYESRHLPLVVQPSRSARSRTMVGWIDGSTAR